MKLNEIRSMFKYNALAAKLAVSKVQRQTFIFQTDFDAFKWFQDWTSFYWKFFSPTKAWLYECPLTFRGNVHHQTASLKSGYSPLKSRLRTYPDVGEPGLICNSVQREIWSTSESTPKFGLWNSNFWVKTLKILNDTIRSSPLLIAEQADSMLTFFGDNKHFQFCSVCFHICALYLCK